MGHRCTSFWRSSGQRRRRSPSTRQPAGYVHGADVAVLAFPAPTRLSDSLRTRQTGCFTCTSSPRGRPHHDLFPSLRYMKRAARSAQTAARLLRSRAFRRRRDGAPYPPKPADGFASWSSRKSRWRPCSPMGLVVRAPLHDAASSPRGSDRRRPPCSGGAFDGPTKGDYLPRVSSPMAAVIDARSQDRPSSWPRPR